MWKKQNFDFLFNILKKIQAITEGIDFVDEYESKQAYLSTQLFSL